MLGATLAAFMWPKLFFIFLLVYAIYLYWRRNSMLFIGIVVFSATLLFLHVQHKMDTLPTTLPETIEVTFQDSYKVKGQYVRGFVKMEDGLKVYVTYKLSSEEEKKRMESSSLVGMKATLTGQLTLPDAPLHRFQFSMASYLKSQGAVGVYEIDKFVFTSVDSSIKMRLGQYRFSLLQKIDETFPVSLAGEAKALLFGDQGDLDQNTKRTYQILGITHLFAISGLHVALLGGLFYQLLLFCRVRLHVAAVLLLIALPIYAVLAGGAPSVWRSVMMTVIVLLIQMRSEKLTASDAISISFIVFVWLQPFSIFQVGFQLSYLATCALIFSSNILVTSHWLKNGFLITFVCQLLVYPLLLYHFYEISLSSFLVNIFLVPLFSFVILPINVFFFLNTFLFSPINTFLFPLYEKLRIALSTLLVTIADLPYQLWQPGRPSMLFVVAMFITVIWMFVFIEKRYYIWATLMIVLPVVSLSFIPKFHDDLRITYLSVGQGDSTIVELPRREQVIVVDVGGVLRFEGDAWKANSTQYEVGRQVVVPYLKGKGLATIDQLILTHADADHAEGAEEVLQELTVRAIYVTPSCMTKPVMQDLWKEAKKQQIPIYEIIAGTSFEIGDVQVDYLWPYDRVYEGNNDSLVLKIARGDFSTLLTGDLEEAGEKELLQKSSVSTTILSPGHHGSKTSSSADFLRATNPQLAIFSTGLNNRYGHPAPEVLERFQSAHIKTLNTAEDGTVEVVVNKNWSYEIHR